MDFKFSSLNIVIRVLLIIANSLAIEWFVLNKPYLFSITFLVGLLFVQILFLISYFNRTDRLVKDFIIRLKYEKSDFNVPIPYDSKSSKRLAVLLTEIKDFVKHVNIEKESSRYYLQTVFKHVDIGLISFDKTLKTEMVNNTFLKLFEIENLYHIKKLERTNEDLYKLIISMLAGESFVLETNLQNKQTKLLIKATELRFKDKTLMLISVQNISHEIEKIEVESWRKLMRVMNHEVRNSMAPIVSLSKALIKIFRSLDDDNTKRIDVIAPEIIEDTKSGLNTIGKRSEGLLKFIENFKTIDTIIKPVIKEIVLNDFILNILQIFKPVIDSNNIRFTYTIYPPDLILRADEMLLEQAFINIIKNAYEAFENSIENPFIKIEAIKTRKQIKIEISNNGIEIPEEVTENIFIPFFTTKEKGSGIGLSVVKQIMLQHKGEISISSKPELTMLTLIFKD